MAGIIDKLRAIIEDEDRDYEVAEYVLERREPNPEPRVKTYDEYVTPEEVEAEGDFTPGEYLLQEIKASGMAGDVVWEEDLEFEGEVEA